MIFEISIVLLTGVFLLILNKIDNNTMRRFGLAFTAVLLFEYFTQALWINKNLESWAYLYLDISWVLTIGWAGIITVCMQVVEMYFKKANELSRFGYSVLFIGIVGFFAEWIVVGLGIRAYPPAVQEVLSGILLGYGKVPIESLYYIPVFMTLMVGFIRYWEISLDASKGKMSIPLKRGKI